MRGPTARGFAPVLREVERGLALPIPDRVRILRELEYDLEELRDRLHAPWYWRVTRHVTANRLRLAERAALAIATADGVRSRVGGSLAWWQVLVRRRLADLRANE